MKRKNQVRPGRVLNKVGLVAVFVSECGGPGSLFPTGAEQLLEGGADIGIFEGVSRIFYFFTAYPLAGNQNVSHFTQQKLKKASGDIGQ